MALCNVEAIQLNVLVGVVFGFRLPTTPTDVEALVQFFLGMVAVFLSALTGGIIWRLRTEEFSKAIIEFLRCVVTHQAGAVITFLRGQEVLHFREEGGF